MKSTFCVLVVIMTSLPHYLCYIWFPPPQCIVEKHHKKTQLIINIMCIVFYEWYYNSNISWFICKNVFFIFIFFILLLFIYLIIIILYKYFFLSFFLFIWSCTIFPEYIFLFHFYLCAMDEFFYHLPRSFFIYLCTVRRIRFLRLIILSSFS